MDGVDDLSVVDPTQIHRGDAEIGMPQLALDDQQRDPLARHLNRVSVAQLMRCEAPPNSGTRGGIVQLDSDASR